MYQLIERVIQCSKCNSQNIGKPANEQHKTIWEYKCFDCGHAKDYVPPFTVVSSWEYDTKDLDKPLTF